MLFDGDERGPDDELRLQFEAIPGFDSQETQIIREVLVLEGLILKHEAMRWATTSYLRIFVRGYYVQAYFSRS